MMKTWSALSRTQRLSVTLCFHGIGEASDACAAAERPYWLPEQQLAEIVNSVDVLQSRHVVDIHLDFDDGYLSDHACVLPLLKAASLRAAFFVPTDWIGCKGHLNAPQIKELVQEGMMIGSHGTDHRAWTELSDDELSRQLRHSKRVLEQLTGTRVEHASAPYGLWSQRVAAAVGEAGYTRLRTCDERPCGPSSFLNHRIVVRAGDDVDAVLKRKLNVFRRAVHKAKDLGERILVQAA